MEHRPCQLNVLNAAVDRGLGRISERTETTVEVVGSRSFPPITAPTDDDDDNDDDDDELERACLGLGLEEDSKAADRNHDCTSRTCTRSSRA